MLRAPRRQVLQSQRSMYSNSMYLGLRLIPTKLLWGEEVLYVRIPLGQVQSSDPYAKTRNPGNKGFALLAKFDDAASAISHLGFIGLGIYPMPWITKISPLNAEMSNTRHHTSSIPSLEHEKWPARLVQSRLWLWMWCCWLCWL